MRHLLAPRGTTAGIKADSAIRPYLPVFFQWQDYIIRTAQVKFHAHGTRQDQETGEYDTETKPMEYAHRFTPTYQKGQIASFYQLEAWMKENPRHVTLLTLTAYQRGKASVQAKGHEVGILEAFDSLKWGWDCLSKILRKEAPGLDYVLVLEPHKSGYPHIHAFLLTPEPLTQALQDKARYLWEQKYKVGDREHGVDFSFSTPEKPIASIRNYLSKYLCKAYYQTVGKYPDTDSRNAMTPGRYVFYALVWKYHWRLVQKSNRLAQVMKYTRKDQDTEYQAVELSRPIAGAHKHSEHREFITVWERVPGAFDPGRSISRNLSRLAQGLIEEKLL